MPNNATYVGAVIIEIDGVEVEVQNFEIKHVTGRKAVKTMNRLARAKGYAQGIMVWELSFTAPVLIGDAEFDWSSINKSKCTYWPIGKPNARRTLRDIFVTNADEKFETDNEATVSVQAEALGKVNE